MWWRMHIKVTIIISVYLMGLEVHVADGFGTSSFGRANTEAPKPATTTAAPGRECRKVSDCGGITGSSCARTHYDPTTRCLCGDNSPPVNGHCEAQTKSLYHTCSNSDECNDGLVCGAPNVTSSPPPHLRMFSAADKICLCDQENGFKEHEHTCSDADILKTSIFAVIIVSCIRKILVS